MPAESANIQQIDGSAVTDTSTVNEGGVVRHGGNVPSDRNLTNKGLGIDAMDSVGSVVSSGTDVTRSVTGDDPTFGMNLGDAQVKLVGNVNYDSDATNRNGLTVAGQSTNVMRGGASDFGNRRNVASIDTIRTFHRAEAIRDGLWNSFGIGGQLNNWESAPTTASSGLWDNSGNDAGVADDDHAAASTLGRPDQNGGTITFHHGRLGNPTNTLSAMGDDSHLVYKPKHGTTS